MRASCRGHVVRNYDLIADHGVRIQGVRFDVFGYVPPDEDFNPEHPATRTDCMKYRAATFNWVRNNLGVVATESGADWTVPYIDLASPRHAPDGIAVPLYDLVYHDAVMSQYRSPDRLRGLLYGGLPVLPDPTTWPDFNEKQVEKELPILLRMAALHARVGMSEMTNHQFLDSHKERTTFADGTSVTVDWDAQTVTIVPEGAP